MAKTKSITIRIPEDEYIAFDAVCNKKGYSKTGKIREFIRELVKKEIKSVKLSAEEGAKATEGIKEIEKREYVSFKELINDLKKKRLGNKKSRK